MTMFKATIWISDRLKMRSPHGFEKDPIKAFQNHLLASGVMHPEVNSMKSFQKSILKYRKPIVLATTVRSPTLMNL